MCGFYASLSPGVVWFPPPTLKFLSPGQVKQGHMTMPGLTPFKGYRCVLGLTDTEKWQICSPLSVLQGEHSLASTRFCAALHSRQEEGRKVQNQGSGMGEHFPVFSITIYKGGPGGLSVLQFQGLHSALQSSGLLTIYSLKQSVLLS